MAEKRFTKSDKDHICDFIIDTHRTRKNNRKYYDAQICEIDRQLRMEPDVSMKKKRDGTIDELKAWLPEAELPGQSQTLEVTSADVMRMILPQSGSWFAPHCMLTDKYLDRVDIQSLITGDENDVPSKITQDNADKLVYGFLDHFHKQYDFRNHLSLITGESIKYSVGVGRARLVNKRVFSHTNQGVTNKDLRIPMIVPRSIKNTYLDDNPASMMNEGHIVSPGHIFFKNMRLKDLQLAAEKGNSDINDMINGGWVKNALNGFEGDDNQNVEFLEWEGDMVCPRKSTETLYLPNVICTVAIGRKGKDVESRLVRIRKNPFPSTSYIIFPYFQEDIETPYGSSPLIKGRPVQSSAVYSLNRLLEVAAFNAQPPVRYDPDDDEPLLYPGSKVQGSSIEVLEIGDPVALSNVYANFLQQYADVTAVNAPRLGAQTVSHTTAYSKEAELARGQIRTVDFVQDTLKGPLTRWLDLEYEMGRGNLKGQTDYFIPQYNGYVTVRKDLLPEEVQFDVFGAGGPAEERIKWEKRMASLQQAVQLDTLRMQQQAQLGQPPESKINLESAIEQVLLEGGWNDLDAITRSPAATQGVAGSPGMEGGGGIDTGTVSTALQALAFGGQ